MTVGKNGQGFLPGCVNSPVLLPLRPNFLRAQKSRHPVSIILDQTETLSRDQAGIYWAGQSLSQSHVPLTRPRSPAVPALRHCLATSADIHNLYPKKILRLKKAIISSVLAFDKSTPRDLLLQPGYKFTGKPIYYSLTLLQLHQPSRSGIRLPGDKTVKVEYGGDGSQLLLRPFCRQLVSHGCYRLLRFNQRLCRPRGTAKQIDLPLVIDDTTVGKI